MLISGRCARAGRSGTAYSLVSPDEYAYLLDLHLFLGRPLTISTLGKKDGVVGRIPQSLLEEQQSSLITLHENHADLVRIGLSFRFLLFHKLIVVFRSVRGKWQKMATNSILDLDLLPLLIAIGG